MGEVANPAGVPVAMRSPGSRVIVRETNASSVTTSKTISAVLESCQVSPMTDERSPRRCGQLVGGHDQRADGREAVGSLGPQPLAILALEIAHRDVVRLTPR
jgi:hypothetical protein